MKAPTELWYDSHYPPKNRFVITFTSHHKTTQGGICTQSQRRFRLADNAEDALQSVMEIDLSPKYWDGENNSFTNVHCECCPNAAVFTLGHLRFSKDVRRLSIANKTELSALVNP